jgi:hypothetical protein
MAPRLNRLLIAALVALISSPALAETIVGQASVINGDTIEIHGSAFDYRASMHPSPINSAGATIVCNIEAARKRRLAAKPSVAISMGAR